MYDVIIAGGGIAGACAAIAAARTGARTLLIEQYGFLGGTLTACGTGPMMTFHAGEIQVIRGIGAELTERLKNKGLCAGHIFDTTGYTYTVTPFNAEGMKTELEEMCLESGAELLYHTVITDAQVYEGTLKSVEIYNKGGKAQLSAKLFVDATGDAQLAFIAGAGFTKGRESDGKCQPLTMNFKLTGVDTAAVKKYIKENPDEFPRLKGDIKIADKAERLSVGGFSGTLKSAQNEGRITFKREDILIFETDRRGEFIVNTTRITGADPTNAEELTRAEIEGRRQAAEVAELLRTRIPGFKKAQVEFTGPFIGVRSSRQIKGAYTLSAKDIISEREFSDTISKGGYPIDVHSPDGQDDNVYAKGHSLRYGGIYSIPYRALVSRDIKNLLCAGRCISADFEAQAAVRVSPNAAATGHAAGTAAAMCALSGTDALQLDAKSLRKKLLEQGAYL
ncbi:MAG: FAD-dependent oxidoreductase [Clostridiales bacterium]|nr:FAD-dependent oxidoreductase [Clostridiales bacterium]